MLLPESVLRTISYYESKTLERDKDYQHYDYVTIHFKSWLKRSKKFKFQCVRFDQDGDTYVKSTTEFTELKEQLDKYFQSKDNDLSL